MKSITTLIEGFKFRVNDERNHSVIIDLPESKGGTDSGPTALALSVMALSGCVSTLFAIIAKNSKLSYSGMSIEVNTEKPEGSKIIESAHVKLYIQSSEPEEKIQRILKKATELCPVGLLYEKAGVNIKTELIVEK